MTEERKPLTPAERGRLGGLQRAQNTTREQREMWGSRGGSTTVERYGRGHMLRLAYMKNGRLPRPKNEAGADSPATSNPYQGGIA